MTYQLDTTCRPLTFDGNANVDKAWDIWGEMQPLERVELAKKIGAFEFSGIKIQRATLNYIADHLELFVIEVINKGVDESDVTRFCENHYKPTRFTNRCSEYKTGVVNRIMNDFKFHGYSLISRHDERSGLGMRVYRNLSFEYFEYVEHRPNTGTLSHLF